MQVFERVLVHTKAQWARRPFLLEDWQRFDILLPLFGWVEWSEEFECWVRSYRLLWLELARKNGKSELLAGIALVLIIADDEESAEVYGCAVDVPQASRVFDVAERMVELSPLLSKRITSYKSTRRLFDPRTNSFYQVIPADAAGNLGQNPHGIVFDEVQDQPDGSLWDALKTGFGTRRQPLLIGSGTAGEIDKEWAWREHQYSERIAADPGLDPTRLCYMRNTPMDADPFDERNWHYANPALTGKRPFLSLRVLRDEAREAKNEPRKEHSFRRFRMNQWQQAGSRWMPYGVWDRCAGIIGATPEELDERAIRQRAFGGLDLSATSDLTSLCWLFPDLGRFAVWRYWLPEAMIEPLDRLTNGNVSAWVKARWITATPGSVIEYDDVYKRIEEDRKRYRVVDLNYDRWSAAPIIQELEKRGLTSVQVAQGYALNAPIREVMKWAQADPPQLLHGGNPVSRWNVLSVEVHEDRFERQELIKPRRGATGARIDGLVALVLAADGVMRRGNVKPPSRKAVGW